MVPTIANGTLYTTDGPISSGSILLANAEIAVMCRPGFTLNGNSSSLCSNWDGKWNPPLGTCDERKSCGPVPSVPGGVVGPGNSTVGSVRLIRCSFSFYLTGTSYIRCFPNGTWSEPGFCLQTSNFSYIQ